MYERARRFFQEDLWNFPLREQRGWRRFCFKWLRIAYLSIHGFYQDKCSLSASSLTYYTLMSIVPVLAMSFAIAGGFGYNDYLRQQILQQFQEHNAAFTELFSYSDKFLEQARGGLVAGIGFIILFWTVCLLLNNLEAILNHIWGVKNNRSWRRIFSDYFALMVIGPFFFLLFSSITVFVVGKLAAAIKLLPLFSGAISLLLFLVNLLPYCLFWIFFSFIYLFMPNVKVHLSSAFWGGFFAGSLYVILQWGYIHFQIGVSRYGAVYGSMAALPLFLIWVQLSWFLFLLGAEISYAHQTSEEHEFEGLASKVSHNFRRLIDLWIVHLALHRWIQGETPLTREILVNRYQIPLPLAAFALRELTECGLLMETKNGYIPARAADQMRLSDVLGVLDAKGSNELPFLDSKMLAPFEKALHQFRKQIEESPENKLLKHVPYSL